MEVLFLIGFLLVASSHVNGEELLGMQQLYDRGRPFANSLEESDKSAGTQYEGVKPYAGPHFGWKTQGKPAVSPTKVADDGLQYVFNGQVKVAKAHANWLIDHAIYQHDTMFFPFSFDYAPFWPYDLKAPWYSSLTQGLVLSLCAYLYRATHEQQYLDWANTIYKSFLIPIEEGGVTRYEDDGPFFEEYPTRIPSRVLNGAILTMIAIHDYAKITGNTAAMDLFQQSVKRLENLLPKYETKSDRGILTSYYSLAPSRTDALGRFIGSSHIFITDMSIYGHHNESKTLLSTIDVGSENDDDVMQDFYIWTDTTHMNWGKPLTAQGISGREVNGERGAYNHSPFKFVINTQETYDAYSIEVVWQGLPYANKKLSNVRNRHVLYVADQKTTDHIDVQLFDGEKYWSAGTIDSFKSDQEKRIEFAFPEGFHDQWLKHNPSEPRIDPRYLDDNQVLVKLIADLTGSQISRTYANRWKGSLDLVPARAFNEAPPNLFSYRHPDPVIGLVDNSDESIHTEYPSVIIIDGIFHMYYCAYGDNLRWKLFHATSTDGMSWTRQGEVFAEGRLPTDFQGNLAFPFVVKNLAASQGYFMYFSVSEERGQPYQKIHYAYSNDGVTWRYEGVAIADHGLDPLVVISPEQKYELYYTRVFDGKASIMYSVSTDGREFSEPVPAVTFIMGRRGLYTISGFYLERRFLLFLESLTPIGRHDTLLWIRDGDRFRPIEQNPVIVDQDWIPRWDARRYGFDFVSYGDKMLLYYNGIPKGGAEKGGQIGMAVLNMDLLKRMIEP
jgi:hypothetical protein